MHTLILYLKLCYKSVNKKQVLGVYKKVFTNLHDCIERRSDSTDNTDVVNFVEFKDDFAVKSHEKLVNVQLSSNTKLRFSI